MGHRHTFTPEQRRRGGAHQIGMTIEEYDAMLASGQKWCCGCQRWQPRADFGADRGRGDGLSPLCRGYASGYNRARYANRKRQRERSAS